MQHKNKFSLDLCRKRQKNSRFSENFLCVKGVEIQASDLCSMYIKTKVPNRCTDN